MTTAFFKLTNADWLESFKRLTRSELGILLHLKTLNPFGDRAIEINTADLASILSLSRRTVQRGLKTLKDLNIINLKTSLRCGFQSQQSENQTETKNTPPRQNCHPDDNFVATASKPSPPRQTRRELLPNPAPSKQSDASQTYTDFIQTLSEAEREKFFSFVREKTKDFNPKIASLTDYLRSQSRYLELYSEFRCVVPAEENNFRIEDWKNKPEWTGILASIKRAGVAFIGIGGIDRKYADIPQPIRKKLVEYVRNNPEIANCTQ